MCSKAQDANLGHSPQFRALWYWSSNVLGGKRGTDALKCAQAALKVVCDFKVADYPAAMAEVLLG